MFEVALKDAITLAFKHLGIKSRYHPREGDPVDIQILPTIKDEVLGLQGSHLHLKTATFKVLVKEVSHLQSGDQLEIEDQFYEIQGAPLKESQDLVWQVEAVKV